MIAIRKDVDAKAIHVMWACVAPHNNIWQYGKQRFSGTGGHLLALASEISFNCGFDGFIYGEAMDRELFAYYCEEYNAIQLPPLNNPYRFMLSDKATQRIREVYQYEWTDDVL